MAMQIFTRHHGGTELGFCALGEPPCLRVRNSYGLRQDLFRDIELLGHRDINNRGLRGGAFNNPTNENDNIGFRVSSLRKAAPA